MTPETAGISESGERPGTRRAALIRGLEERLRPVCRDWPPELFSSMVEGLADSTLKYDHAPGTSVHERRTTDRLVADLKDALARSELARDKELS